MFLEETSVKTYYLPIRGRVHGVILLTRAIYVARLFLCRRRSDLFQTCTTNKRNLLKFHFAIGLGKSKRDEKVENDGRLSWEMVFKKSKTIFIGLLVFELMN
jgi:hypothetical protein